MLKVGIQLKEGILNAISMYEFLSQKKTMKYFMQTKTILLKRNKTILLPGDQT